MTTMAVLDSKLISKQDVLEEAGLSRAIDEGLKTKPATRDEVCDVLESG